MRRALAPCRGGRPDSLPGSAAISSSSGSTAGWRSRLLTFPAGSSFLQLRVEVPDRRIVPGVVRAADARLSAGTEIAPPEQVAGRDHCRPHGTVLVRPLRPRQISIQPEIVAHGVQEAGPAAGLLATASAISIETGGWFGITAGRSIRRTRRRK